MIRLFPFLLLAIIGSTTLFWPAAAFTFPPKPTFERIPVALKVSEESLSVDDVPENFTPPKPSVKCPDCDLCDGSGRILGGIAVVLPWWPIKAYRPCPNFIAAGGKYIRSGQPLDEIAFGRSSNYDDEDNF